MSIVISDDDLIVCPFEMGEDTASLGLPRKCIFEEGGNAYNEWMQGYEKAAILRASYDDEFASKYPEYIR